MVMFEQDNMQVVMDRDAFDYNYGDTDGSDPSQRALDALLPTVTRVCVLDGPMFQGRAMGGKVMLDTSDARALRDLARCLRIVEDPDTFNHCACLGGPTMELYAGLEHVATIGLQHGRAIRWKQWYHDAQLQSGDQLTKWLHNQGVDPGRLEAIYQRGGNIFVEEENGSSPREKESQHLCLKAQELAQEGKLAEAQQLCTQALGLDPDQAEAYALRAQIHYQMGGLRESADDCSTAIDCGLRHAGIYFIRAIAMDSAGRADEALADCSMALHLDSAHAAAYNSRGLIRGRLGRFDEAFADFSEAIRLEPKWFLPYLHRAQISQSKAQLDSALADYDRAVELVEQVSAEHEPAEGDPMAALVYCRRGDARHDQFQEAEAEADFAEARHHHPAAAAGYLGEMWIRRGNFGRAFEVFTQLLDLRPNDPQGYLGRAAAAEALGDLEQTCSDCTEAIRVQPEGSIGYVVRARARYWQGRLDDALADLTEHLQRHPADAMAYHFRYAVRKELKELAAALQDLTDAHRLAPNEPQVCNSLAWFLATCTDFRLRDGARAVTFAHKACEATEWNNSYCLDTLAAALAETGAFEEAVKWQTQAVDSSPEDRRPARQARLEMYEAGQAFRE